MDEYSIGGKSNIQNKDLRVKGICDVPPDSRTGREWWEMITQKNYQLIGLQSVGLDARVSLAFDGDVPLIEANNNRIAFGPSEQAQINVIAGEIDRLPQHPQLIFAETPIISYTRLIDLSDRGTLDLIMTNDGVTIGEVR